MGFNMEALAQRENREGTEQSTVNNRKPASKTYAKKAPLALADPFRLYLLDIGRHGLLSREDKKELAIRVREGND
jgi:hypothetical protein